MYGAVGRGVILQRKTKNFCNLSLNLIGNITKHVYSMRFKRKMMTKHENVKYSLIYYI